MWVLTAFHFWLLIPDKFVFTVASLLFKVSYVSAPPHTHTHTEYLSYLPAFTHPSTLSTHTHHKPILDATQNSCCLPAFARLPVFPLLDSILPALHMATW